MGKRGKKGYYRGQPIAIASASPKLTPTVQRPVEVYVVELRQDSAALAETLQLVMDRFFQGDIRIRPRIHAFVSGVEGSLAVAARELTQNELTWLFLHEPEVVITEQGKGWRKFTLDPSRAGVN